MSGFVAPVYSESHSHLAAIRAIFYSSIRCAGMLIPNSLSQSDFFFSKRNWQSTIFNIFLQIHDVCIGLNLRHELSYREQSGSQHARRVVPNNFCRYNLKIELKICYQSKCVLISQCSKGFKVKHIWLEYEFIITKYKRNHWNAHDEMNVTLTVLFLVAPKAFSRFTCLPFHRLSG